MSTPEHAFQNLRDQVTRRVGARLFTMLQWIPETGILRRVYTSHRTEYPVGAEKSVEISTAWLQVVIGERRTFLAATPDELAEVFGDADLIASLGCGAVINAPIIADGDVVGVLAILDAAGSYDLSSVTEVDRIVDENGADLARAFTALSTSDPEEIQ